MPYTALPINLRFVVAALLFGLVLSTAPVFGAHDQEAETLVLTQVSDGCGRTTTYISKQSIKITFADTRVSLVATAPEWKVVFFNDANKKALTMSFDQWLKHIVQIIYADVDFDRFGLVVAPKYLVKRDGREMRRLVVQGFYRGKQLIPCELARNGEYLVIEGAQVPPQACFIMQKTLSCPKIIGVPVEFINHKKAIRVKGFDRYLGGDDHWLSTSKIEEKTVPSKFFGCPSGYMAVQKEVEVMDDDKRKHHVEDVIKDLLPDH